MTLNASQATDRQLAELVAPHTGVPPDRLRLTPTSTGSFNTSWYIDGGPAPLLLRIAPPDDPSIVLFYEYRIMRQEPPIHALLREKTSIPVPAIIAFDTSHTRLDRDYLIIERVSGKPLSDASLRPDGLNRLLAEVGDALRQAHAIQGQAFGYIGEHQPMIPQSDWTSAFVIMWNKLLDDIERCDGYTPDEADQMRGLLDKHLAVFNRHVPASLLHMDVWAQNVLCDSAGRLTALLDWDRACWGDPEIEFAILDYCGFSEPAFWEGYGQERDLSGPAHIRQRLYLLYEVQKYIFIERARVRSVPGADAYRRESLRLAREIA